MLYIPHGFAHGFLTLKDHSEVSYQISEFYSAEHSAGFRWDGPSINIQWPVDNYIISDRDKSFQLIDGSLKD